ncbi:hypothetical protein [Lyngbya sp. CCY1209]|uniref:hypothetical protein n=1 Tax=Lyngbya sp. CCY1209 TaxID=2886103 RepID=UPI002D20268F|nr:hypothetical protein [Lyngbya sp. CCY1209]MEB3883328.1 hypothetical protein [Lyngbya sp. CCY1209]
MNWEAVREELRKQLLSDIDRRMEEIRAEVIAEVDAKIDAKMREIEGRSPTETERKDLQALIAALLKEHPRGLSAEAIAASLSSPSSGGSPDLEDIRTALERGCHEHRDRGGEMKGTWLTSYEQDGETIYRLLGSAAVSS